MQQYFYERGDDYMEVMEKLNKRYGGNFRILTKKEISATGFRGLFGKKQIECFGYFIIKEGVGSSQRIEDERNKRAILTSVGVDVQNINRKPNQGMDEVLEEIRGLKEQLGVQEPSSPEPFKTLSELTEILKDNEFEDVYIEKLLNGIRGKLTASELENRKTVHCTAALEIARTLEFLKPETLPRSRIFILVGPTGVGKTTTIAKLAAIHGLSGRKRDVRMVTVDNFRIGARAQLETYGEIMEIPVKAVDGYEQLKTQIALFVGADLILIDTIGKNPRKKANIDKMKELLSACESEASVHLALSATTKPTDLRQILKQFQSFDYSSIVVTKLDETSSIGSLISILSEHNVGVSYCTDGQSVPVDIALASPSRFLRMVRGLEADCAEIDRCYPTLDLTKSWR